MNYIYILKKKFIDKLISIDKLKKKNIIEKIINKIEPSKIPNNKKALNY